MAKPKITNTPQVKDITLFWSDLNFFPEDLKLSKLWLAQAIFYAQKNSSRFLDPKKAKIYRKLDVLELNKQEYINIIDPKTPQGGGGTASYFSADFKANPIDAHLDNIILAKLDKIGIENKIQVNEIDKYAKMQRQKEKDKLIYQHLFRDIINHVLVELNMSPLSESQDPYKYAASLATKGGKKSDDKDVTLKEDKISGVLDYIKSQINDSQTLALYQSYIYRGNIELAFELGIEHYLINLNKWRIISQDFNRDIKNFNRACGRWYTDETNGRGTVEYIDPTELFTSPFKTHNGEDIVFWYHQKLITFAEFVRRFGETLTDEQLKEVFELNKVQGAGHNMSYSKAGGVSGSNAFIQVGFFSILTQDAESFSEKLVNDKIKTWQPKPLNWIPETDSEEKRQRIYNTWYSCYYVPPPGDRLQNNQQTDWAWQSQYIFDMKKDIDMYRYGIDMRYAKSTLVIWQDVERPSYMDIKQAYMPKINTLWHKFQNCIVQDMTGLAMDWDLISGLLNVADEANSKNIGNVDEDKPSGNNGYDAAMEQWKMLRQSGMAWLKFRDKNGNVVVNDPSKLFVPIDTKHLDKAENYLKVMMQLYDQMTVALSATDASLGQIAPRQNEQSITSQLNAANEGIWFMEKACREMLIMYGERCVQHILAMIKEKKKYGFKQRWEELTSAIGIANASLLDSIEGIEAEDLALTVSLEDVKAKTDFFINMAMQMLRDGKIETQDVQLIVDTIQQNYKYGAVLMVIAANKMEKKKSDFEELQHQRALEMQQAQQQSAMMMLQAQTQSKIALVDEEGKIKMELQQLIAQLKTLSQSQLIDQKGNNRQQEAKTKAELEAEAEQRKKLPPIQ